MTAFRMRFPRHPSLLPGGLLGLLAAFTGACGGTDSGPLPSNGRPVVLISIDSFRADHSSAYGYRPHFAPEVRTTPFLERLAREGVLFEHADSPCSWTLPSHMSLLTGMQCPEHGVRNRTFRLGEGTELLAGRFQRAGYATAGFYSAPFLHGSWGFAFGFDTYQPGSPYLDGLGAVKAITDRGPGSLRGLHHASHVDRMCSERVVDRALAWLGEGDRREKPFFLFLHLWDPHYDYDPPRKYVEMFDPGYKGPVNGKDYMETDWPRSDLGHLEALYDGEIRYTDDQIARFFEQLEKWGLADKVIFAVTADHGDEFFEHGQKGHQKTLFEEVVHIPMLIRAQGEVPAGRRITPTVALYDLAPTLLDLAGVPAWEGRSGRSLTPFWRAGGEVPPHAIVMDLEMPGPAKFRAWRQGDLKFIWNVPKEVGALFHLDEDPGELRGRKVESLQGDAVPPAAREALRKASQFPGHALPMTESPEMTRILAELGYTGEEEAPQED